MNSSIHDSFARRHLGPSDDDIVRMLEVVGHASLDELTDAVIPKDIRTERALELDGPLSEADLLAQLRDIAGENRALRSYIGMGYHGTVTPPVIRRNILENPGWYTQYTPYQAEISQGRLEALLNFQTMVMELTGLEIANASLLDEATAAAEAMTMVFGDVRGRERDVFLVSRRCHPQTVAVVRNRARPLGIRVEVAAEEDFELSDAVFGLLVQYPGTEGDLPDLGHLLVAAGESGIRTVVAADLLALTLLAPPGEIGADVAVGNTQRFGVPMGYGGPHAAYIAASDRYKRRMPGRIIGVSRDAADRSALRMALQTREQHIRREKATSNICTAQVLLAVMAGMYAVYHGPDGLRAIGERVHRMTRILATGLEERGHRLEHDTFFDTLRVRPAAGTTAEAVLAGALDAGINLRDHGDGTIGVALDETVGYDDVDDIMEAFGSLAGEKDTSKARLLDREGAELVGGIPDGAERSTPFLEHEVFGRFHSETEMLRYLNRLQSRDLSLTHSMIPLGSCTMKLNATAQMEALSWPGFSNLHPFAPPDQARGYARIIADLERWLGEITGLEKVSLQPNSGAQGEFAGLLVIRAYHEDRGEAERDVCLIPASAHGTNPASAVMAGMRVVVVDCDEDGNIDLYDLRAKCTEHSERLGAIMITYPSTHGVFEPAIREVCDIVHRHGGQVYLDGANLNAQVGLCRPGEYGADVCHVNLHKTFAIPHGGGGPGMGPICAAPHLGPYLPGHPEVEVGGEKAIGPISAAPWGSASILLISWAYMALLGPEGQLRATQVALLNANYMAKRLADHYAVLYTGPAGAVAHEFILDLRPFRREAGVTEEDVAKRLMDYGFHAPTMSWPVPGTVMVEPTESESLEELDRFCDALISIRAEIQRIEMGIDHRDDNPLRNAPHTAEMVVSDEWDRPYGREQAAFPVPWTRDRKFWPAVRRVDNAYGDRNLVCACPPLEVYATGD